MGAHGKKDAVDDLRGIESGAYSNGDVGEGLRFGISEIREKVKAKYHKAACTNAARGRGTGGQDHSLKYVCKWDGCPYRGTCAALYGHEMGGMRN